MARKRPFHRMGGKNAKFNRKGELVLEAVEVSEEVNVKKVKPKASKKKEIKKDSSSTTKSQTKSRKPRATSTKKSRKTQTKKTKAKK